MATQLFVNFGDVLNKRADSFQPAAAKIARSVAAAIGEELARETPVATGAARSNWIMTIDQIANYVIPAYVPYLKPHQSQYAIHKETAPHPGGGIGDKEEQANLVAVLSQHFVALQSFDPERNSTIYIANNIPYMEKLNAGYSNQTPAGWVKRAVEKGMEVARNYKLMEG